MALEFPCPGCGQTLTVSEENAGQIGNCYACGAELRAPAEAGQPAFLLKAGRAQSVEGAPRQPVPGNADPGAVVSESWKLLLRNWWAVLLSLLMAAGITLIWLAPVLGLMLMKMIPVLQDQDAMNRVMSRYTPLMTLWSLVAAPLNIGPLFVAWRAVSRDQIDIAATFAGFRRYADFLVAGIVFNAPSFLLVAVPGYFLTGNRAFDLLSLPLSVLSYLILLPLSLARVEMIDKGARPMEAFRASIEGMRGNYLSVLVCWVILLVIAMAGVLACCVGLFFTMPITMLGEVVIYRRLRGLNGPKG